MKSKLKEIMDSTGMKQRFLANKVGISEGTLSFIVRGKTIPTLPVALKIAAALERRIEDIWEIKHDTE
ncbi:helix-turn-helix transcriptional regulator [Fictibacillus sp. Sa2CUA10]|uniref:Helix-turn-helix transcriptional regulator n=1 Tax=Fictibacillus norfolkensis TaxID=2762233 RepID=A0ABR8SS18_9BACL|nr:helix-turn-helix transcriptional regulator [Fictibacillus norfolkensis]